MNRWLMIVVFLVAVVAIGLMMSKSPTEAPVAESELTRRSLGDRSRPTSGLTPVERSDRTKDSYRARGGTGVVLPGPEDAPDEESEERCEKMVEKLAQLGMKEDKGGQVRLEDPVLRTQLKSVCGQMKVSQKLLDCVLGSKGFEGVESCGLEIPTFDTKTSDKAMQEEAKRLGVKLPPPEPDDEDDEEEKGNTGPAQPD